MVALRGSVRFDAQSKSGVPQKLSSFPNFDNVLPLEFILTLATKASLRPTLYRIRSQALE
jgi:hypothetical protein